MPADKYVLVTGGAGYIGSHTCVELIKAGYDLVVLDNLANSKIECIRRVEQIVQRKINFYEGDIRDKALLDKIFTNYKIDSVVHFAGLKAVGESCQQPIHYYQNNFYGTLMLSQAMSEHNVKKIVFSSSATVYGDPHKVPIDESFPLSATNPYGRSKLMVEELFRDISLADVHNQSEYPWKIALLRYFNPIGAHSSGLIGEDPKGIPNNLIPYVAQVAIGKREQVSVFGNDYPTRDGTGVRDYIHVVDLAKGHVKALSVLDDKLYMNGGCNAFNLGTGTGYSVLELIKTFEEVTGRKINYRITSRRSGDVAECYADPQLALQKLGWKAEKMLHEMVADTWLWQEKNPDGFV